MNITKKNYFLLVLLCSYIIGNANAQVPSFLWAKSTGGAYDDHSYSIAVDAGSNVYTTGYFQSTVDFDPGAGVFNLTPTGAIDIFISKLNSSGNFVWAKQMGGTGYDDGFSIAVDAAANIYTTGFFDNTADFDPGPGLFNLTSISSDDIFISKLDSSGNFVWAKAMGGGGLDGGKSIAVDASGNLYITGYFSNTVDFDPDTGVFNLTAPGNFNIFISKFDASGNFAWAKAMGGTGIDMGISIIVDAAGNVYTTGYFQHTVDFDPGTGVFNLTPAGVVDIFISKLDSSGNFVWAKAMGGPGNDEPFSIATDASGNVYTTGDFYATADFDPGPGVYNITATAFSDIFIWKLDSSGNYVWARAMGGTGWDHGLSIAVDASANVYTTGYFEETADFNPDTGVFNLTSAGTEDIFISKLDSSGDFVWATAIGGTDWDRGISLTLNTAGNLYLTGDFLGSSISFGPTILTNSHVGALEIFVTKLDVLTGIENAGSENGVMVYPNPAADHFTLSWSNIRKNVQVTITDITGQLVFLTTTKETKIDLETENFAEGVYVVQIQAGDFTETKKLIVVK